MTMHYLNGSLALMLSMSGIQTFLKHFSCFPLLFNNFFNFFQFSIFLNEIHFINFSLRAMCEAALAILEGNSRLVDVVEVKVILYIMREI